MKTRLHILQQPPGPYLGLGRGDLYVDILLARDIKPDWPRDPAARLVVQQLNNIFTEEDLDPVMSVVNLPAHLADLQALTKEIPWDMIPLGHTRDGRIITPKNDFRLIATVERPGPVGEINAERAVRNHLRLLGIETPTIEDYGVDIVEWSANWSPLDCLNVWGGNPTLNAHGLCGSWRQAEEVMREYFKAGDPDQGPESLYRMVAVVHCGPIMDVRVS